jgi:hypothetical protein
MKAPLKPVIIDGNDRRPAPRPQRRSLVRVLYDTVDAIGGDGATLTEIVSYLPAAIEADETDIIIDVERIRLNLQTQVHAGYFIFNPTEQRYRIAPMSYYQACRKRLQESRANSNPLAPRPPPVVLAPPRDYRNVWIAGAFGLGIWVGLLIGDFLWRVS